MATGVNLRGAVVTCGALATWMLLTAARAPIQQVRDGDAAGAVTALEQAETRAPRDPGVKRALGVALLESGDAAGAIAKLEESLRLRPRDPAALFELGRAAERADRPQLALDAYGRYLALGGPGSPEVRARVREISLGSMREVLRRALQTEHAAGVDSIPLNTVAVPPFAVTGLPDSLAPLARGLGQVMCTDLSQVARLRVLERQRLQVLLEELDRATPRVQGPAGSGAPREVMDRASAPLAGRLLGARRFAQGGLSPLAAGRVQLDGALLDVADASLRTTGPPVSGEMHDVLALEKALVFQALDSLGVVPTPAERRAIGAPPTRSFPAFLAYSRGLVFEDQGRTADALGEFRRAIVLDPSFALARQQQAVLSVTPADQAALDRRQQQSAMAPDDSGSRLLQSGMEVGLRLGPSPHDPDVPPGARVQTVNVNIVITPR